MNQKADSPRRRFAVSWILAVSFAAIAAAHAQDLRRVAKPDPAAQRAAFEAQKAILESPNQFGTKCCQILQIPAAAFTSIDPSTLGYLSAGSFLSYETLVSGS